MKTVVMFCAIVLLLSALMGDAFGGYEGNFNTFYGLDAGYSTTVEDAYDTFIGAGAGYTNTEGYYNTFVGEEAGFSNTTGYENTFLGYLAGYDNTTGYNNTFLGNYAGYTNTEGYYNTFFGRAAGASNTTGYENTYLGGEAGAYNNTGLYNTFLGTYAGWDNVTGSGNVFLGYGAGQYETGSNKLYIDNLYTDMYPPYTSTPLIYGEFDNQILTINGNLHVIGPYQGLVYLSNTTADSTNKVSRMVLSHYSNAELPVYLFGAASTLTNNFVAFGGGNSIGNAATQIDLFTAENTTTPVGTSRLTIVGNGYVGIGTQAPSYPLQMASGAYVTTGGVWTNASSREYKENIEGLKAEDAIETLQGLNPVTFSYKVSPEENHVGFVAEEVPNLVATKDRKGLSPMDIVAVLTKVVQEQQRGMREQQRINQEQQKTIFALTEELRELKREVRAKGADAMAEPSF